MIKSSFLCGINTFLLSLFVQQAVAAPCCGGGLAVPSLIVGDQQAQVSFIYSRTQITDDVGSDGLWRSRAAAEASETYKLEGVHLLADRWQAGISMPFVRRQRLGQSSSGLGDVSATLGYEYWPAWEYRTWRPQGVVYLRGTAPSGRSTEESVTPFQLDSRGRGFWSMGAGTLMTKTWKAADVLATFEVRRSFAKTSERDGELLHVQPGWGGSVGLGGGALFSSLRIGSTLTWLYEDPVNVSGVVSSQGEAQRSATFTLEGSYRFEQDWIATLTYLDQTLFGSPTNTSLGRGVVFLLQRRWSR